MKMLVAADLSESTAGLLLEAEKMALALSATVVLLHVAEPEPDFVGLEVGPDSVRDSLAQAYRSEHRQIQAIAEQWRQSGLEATALLVQGPTAATILSEAMKLAADMIVVGSHGRGMMQQLLVGSVSKGVLQAAKIPVLVVPTHGRG